MTAQRLVWTGGLHDVWPGGADDRTHTPTELVDAIARAHELVVIDSPSFPWASWSGELRDIRVVARLPEELDAQEIAGLLGPPLLAQITPFDRLHDPRAAVRAELSAAFDLPDVVWIPDGPEPGWHSAFERYLRDAEDDLALALESKPRLNQLVQAVGTDLAHRLPRGADDSGPAEVARPLVMVSGPSQLRPVLFESPLTAVCRRPDAREVGDPDSPLRTPDACVVVLPDGGTTAADRRAQLRDAFQRLGPGGLLLVVAHVVTQSEQSPNPSISQLLEDIDAASGCALRLEELRSVHWAGEVLTRGVVIRFASLRSGAP